MIFKYLSWFLIFVWVINWMLRGLNFADTWYHFIPINDMNNEIVRISSLLPKHDEPFKENCDYPSIINKNYEFTEYDLEDIFTRSLVASPIERGGEHVPSSCQTHFSVAIIVPYRNRKEQLNKFLKFFHYFLQKQYLHYRIYIVDQLDNQAFNRALLLNIGAVVAIKDKFPCLIFTDIDLIPLNLGNLYVCTSSPRHMSTLIDVFRYHLLYGRQFGGATAMLTSQFKQINGFSNRFYGWGGEDDDVFHRLGKHQFLISRYDPLVSRYMMMKHKKQKPSPDRFKVLNDKTRRSENDGLNSIPAKYNVTLEKLYTHIKVYG